MSLGNMHQCTPAYLGAPEFLTCTSVVAWMNNLNNCNQNTVQLLMHKPGSAGFPIFLKVA